MRATGAVGEYANRTVTAEVALEERAERADKGKDTVGAGFDSVSLLLKEGGILTVTPCWEIFTVVPPDDVH